MGEVIKIDGEDYIKAKDVHEWLKREAGVKGMLLTYKMFLGFIKDIDKIKIKK